MGLFLQLGFSGSKICLLGLTRVEVGPVIHLDDGLGISKAQIILNLVWG